MISALLKPIEIIRNVTITGVAWAKTVQKWILSCATYLLLAKNGDLQLNSPNILKDFTEQTVWVCLDVTHYLKERMKYVSKSPSEGVIFC